MNEVWTVLLSILRPVNQLLMHYRNKTQKIVTPVNLSVAVSDVYCSSAHDVSGLIQVRFVPA